MVLLEAGPAHGRHIPDPRENWVWVDIDNGDLLVFDPAMPEALQHQQRRVRGGWNEYILNPRDPATFRWARKTPVLPQPR